MMQPALPTAKSVEEHTNAGAEPPPRPRYPHKCKNGLACRWRLCRGGCWFMHEDNFRQDHTAQLAGRPDEFLPQPSAAQAVEAPQQEVEVQAHMAMTSLHSELHNALRRIEELTTAGEMEAATRQKLEARLTLQEDLWERTTSDMAVRIDGMESTIGDQYNLLTPLLQRCSDLEVAFDHFRTTEVLPHNQAHEMHKKEVEQLQAKLDQEQLATVFYAKLDNTFKEQGKAMETLRGGLAALEKRIASVAESAHEHAQTLETQSLLESRLTQYKDKLDKLHVEIRPLLKEPSKHDALNARITSELGSIRALIDKHKIIKDDRVDKKSNKAVEAEASTKLDQLLQQIKQQQDILGRFAPRVEALSEAKDTQRDQINAIQDEIRHFDTESMTNTISDLRKDVQDALAQMQNDLHELNSKFFVVTEWCGLELCRTPADGTKGGKGNGKRRSQHQPLRRATPEQ